MAKNGPASVEAYLASFPPDVRATLERVRAAIRRGLPKAEEAISYAIPVFKLNGERVMYFAGWKRHFSIYPVGGLLDAFGQELAGHRIAKGTIQFPLDEPVPVKLIERMARFRGREVARASRP